MTAIITFYSTREVPYGCFSNFAPYRFELDGLNWRTSEHYFQAQKFFGRADHMDAVRMAKSPKEAAELGRDKTRPLRADWDAVKDDVMRQAVLRKFETHTDILTVLLDTGDAQIVEKTTGDYYWGCGLEGTGKNMLGVILMETREQLRKKLIIGADVG